MKQYDKDFDLQDLTFEAEEIFKEFYGNYLAGHLIYLEKVCGKAALAIVKSEVKRRQTEGWQYKYEDIIDCGGTTLVSGTVPDKCPPTFTYQTSVQMIDCTVDAKTGEVKAGGDSDISTLTYRVAISRHDDPDVALTGHYWEIVEFQKLGDVKLLV